jgi:hypothetical protein
MMKTPLMNILNEILTMDSSDINKIVEAVKMRRDLLHFQNTKSFKSGDRVQFTSSRTGKVLTGKVDRVKIKYVVVDCDNGERWNIPGGMLKLISQTVKEIA